MGDRVESLVRMLQSLGVQSAGFHPDGALAHVTFATGSHDTFEALLPPEAPNINDPFMSAALELAGQKADHGER